MKAGQKLTANDGYQVCLYPLPSMDVIQASPSSFSHCCGYAIDVNTVPPSSYATMYAPCDCEFYYQDGIGNSCAFISTNKVHTPSGLTYVCFQFTHGKLLGKGAIQGKGAKYKQGEAIYTTGLDNANGIDHCHIDQCRANSATDKVTMRFMGVYCSSGNACWVLAKSCKPNEIFYVNDTAMTGRLGGYKWITWTKGGNNTIVGGGSSGGAVSNPSLKWVIPVIAGSEYTKSRYLTDAEMKNNYRCFYGEMNARGWSLNSICGMLGNIKHESGCNPNTWEGQYKYTNPTERQGFGLVQWTPYTKIESWLKERNVWGKFEKYGTAQCERIEWELKNGAQWSATASYPMSFAEFKKSKQDAGYLAIVFVKNYERGGYGTEQMRANSAREIYNYLKDLKPSVPDGAVLDGSDIDGDFDLGDGTESSKEDRWKWIYYMKGKNK